ncbi:MAG: hypothetical protein IPN81_14545 [Nitrosomonadales bacterium]|nr:hypothetical protein [Nitrosomonadales bacterium]
MLPLQDLATLLHRVALAQTVPQTIAEDEPERTRLLELAQSLAQKKFNCIIRLPYTGVMKLTLRLMNMRVLR